jgi:hypothetical protein
MRSAISLLFLAALFAPGFAQAMDCAAPNPAQPLRPLVLAPVASELALLGNPLGATTGVLSHNEDPSESVDQVLLRIRIESCHDVASITPAPGVVSPDNPAAYKPRTEFDNTPWRFNMNQNGKNMTADEFSAWMKSRGVRVARGKVALPAATDPTPDAAPAPAPAAPLQPSETPVSATPPKP